MDAGLPPIGGFEVSRAAGAGPAGAAGKPGAPKGEFKVDLPGPPPEVTVEISNAAKRVDELRAQKRELRFERDDKTGRIRVEVRDLDGNVLRVIPASMALEIARGAPLR